MIQVKNISKIYSLGKVKVPALTDINFQINSGEMVCIMGKSGSGKSTLLRQIGLIDKPNSGSILINEIEVTKLSESKRTDLRLSDLGFIFQEYALIPELTASENVYLPAMMKGGKRKDLIKKANELLELLDLSTRLDHRPNELSGGEQQRVAIARALVNNPKIIFADEATANLDSISAKTVMESLQKINKELCVTVIFVSHDPDDKKYANRIIELSDGKVIN